MRILIAILVMMTFGCTKQEQCYEALLVVTSSEDSARQKCKGLANSHPEFKIISSKIIGCYSPKEIREAERANNTITKSMCAGVDFQIVTRVK